jgi:hypothetical protein
VHPGSAVLTVLFCLPSAGRDWGEAVARPQSDGRWEVRLENSRIRIAYGRTDFGDIVEDQIVDFTLRPSGENQAGKQFDEMGFGAHEGRGLITRAEVVESGAGSKTVRIEWERGKSVQEVAIYRDSPIVKMDYIKYGLNVVDIASPGGGDGVYVVHGADKWKRDFVLYPKIYYDRHPKDVGRENITGIDEAGPLEYHGWFILGIYSPKNGRGYGRVMPVDRIDIIKLLHNRGYELFTCLGCERPPFTGFVYAVTGGAEEILAVGKQIADARLPVPPRISEPRGAAAAAPQFLRAVVDGRTGAWFRDVKIAGDFDGDGFPDIVAGHYPLDYKDPAPLIFYRYPDWRRTTIGTGYFTTDGQAADVDGDGDLDVVTGDETKKCLLWFENPRPRAAASGRPWRAHTIGTLAQHFTHDIETGDFDRDGRVDVFTRIKGPGAHLWLQRPAGRWQPLKIAAMPDGQGSALADIDRDGDLDIAAEGCWLENPGAPLHGGWTLHRFAAGWPDDVGVAVADLNGDRLPDILLAPAESIGRLAWYQAPADPRSGRWIEHVVDPHAAYVHTFKVADVDLDASLDIVVGEMHQSATKRIGWYRNLGKGAAWKPVVIARTGVHNLRIADFGSDGDIDLFGANWAGDNPVEVWENQLRSPGALARKLPLDRWTYIQVDNRRAKWGDFDEPKWLKYFGLAAADIDRDNFRDILAGRYVYRNPGGAMEAPWRRVEFPLNADGMLLASVEKDGRVDAIAERLPDVFWLRPDDPQGNAWTPLRVGTMPAGEHRNGQGYALAQLEPGGRPEIVLSTSGGLFYFRIPGKAGEGEWPRVRISAGASEEGFAAGDFDGDGSLDIAAAGRDGRSLVWFRNPGNGAADWTAYAIGRTEQWCDRVAIADMNADGRPDVIVTEETPLKHAGVYWFEHPGDPKQAWRRHTVATQYTTNSMDVADMDGDGDPDIVTGEHRGTRKLAVWENLDRGARFAERLVSAGRESHLGARVFDLDGDGDLDILSIAWDSYPYLHLWRNDAVRGTQ